MCGQDRKADSQIRIRRASPDEVAQMFRDEGIPVILRGLLVISKGLSVISKGLLVI